jgi:hypothetical protein
MTVAAFSALSRRFRRRADTMAGMEFRLLGPVEVLDDSGRRIELAANSQRVLLAALLLQPNRVVATQDLVDTLWESELPARPRSALQTYVSRLRTMLGGAIIRTEHAGYLISVSPDGVDLTRFRSLVAESSGRTDLAERAALLTEALAMWRGEPLAGLSAGALIRDAVPVLTEERLHATELLLAARLELGHHAQLTAELSGLTPAPPPSRAALGAADAGSDPGRAACRCPRDLQRGLSPARGPTRPGSRTGPPAIAPGCAGHRCPGGQDTSGGHPPPAYRRSAVALSAATMSWLTWTGSCSA